MKKIMFLLAFAGMGLFGNANNGKIFNEKINIKELTAKASPKKTTVGSWMYTVNCPDHVYTGCCWATQSEAYMYGEMSFAIHCPFA